MPTPVDNWAVSDLHHGDVLSERFRLILRVGSGSTGVVWSAVDTQTQTSDSRVVAVKITRYIEDVGSASRIMGFARYLGSKPGRGRQFLCLPQDYTNHHLRDCFVYDLFSKTLREIICDIAVGEISPLSGHHIRVIAWQLFCGVAFLHDLNIAHTDIKPENIVLVDSSTVEVKELDRHGNFVTKILLRSIEIKIIDFDDAKDTGQRSWNHIGTLSYQAPEIICGIGWTKAVDVFAAACTVYELYMENVLGKIPEAFLAEVKNINPEVFEQLSSGAKLPRNSDLGEDQLRRQVETARPLWRSIRRVDLMNLLKGCLAADPVQRISAAMALRLNYFFYLVHDV